jgi:hypothetical protein
VAKIKEKELEPKSNSDSEHNKGKQIIDAKPTATIVATTIQPKELGEPKEGECLFHS